MPKPFAEPNITTSQGLVEHANNLVNGYLVNGLLAVAGIGLFIILRARFYRMSDSAAMAAFGTFILSSFLWAMGMVMSRVVVLLLIITIVCTLWSVFEK